MTKVQVTLVDKKAPYFKTQSGEPYPSVMSFLFDFGAGNTFNWMCAPGRGLVYFGLPGTGNRFVRSGVVGGRKFGRVEYSVLESGPVTNYPMTGTNKVWLIKTPSVWTAFYAKHKPGQTAPAIDFSKKTVLVALGGYRPTAGYSLDVDSVVWSLSSVKLDVIETPPAGIAAQVVTNPYLLAVVDGKVSWASAQWVVTDPPDPD